MAAERPLAAGITIFGNASSDPRTRAPAAMGVRSLSCRSLLWFADSVFLTVTGLALFFCPSLLGHQDRTRDQTVQMMGASVAALGGLLLSHANGMPHAASRGY